MGDKLFTEMLNRIWRGCHKQIDLKLTNTRKIPNITSKYKPELPGFPTRKMVQKYNEEVLEKTTEFSIIIRAIDIPPENIPDGIKEKLLEKAENRKWPETTGGL